PKRTRSGGMGTCAEEVPAWRRSRDKRLQVERQETFVILCKVTLEGSRSWGNTGKTVFDSAACSPNMAVRVTTMMSCVNRNCNRPMAHFSEGRLFHFEILSISVTADDDKKRDFDEVPHREGV